MRVSTLTEEVVAWVYVLDAFEGGLPSASYLGILADAAEAADAPADYVAALRARALPLELRRLSSSHDARLGSAP